MAEPADSPAKPPRGRNLVGFYAAIGVVAALVGLGVCLYWPLRLDYAIKRLDGSRAAPAGSGTAFMSVSWEKDLAVCVEAARHGNEPAMAAVLRQVKRHPYMHHDSRMEETLAGIARNQPERFYALLAREPRDFVLSALESIEVSCDVADQRTRGPNVAILRTDVPGPWMSEEERFRLEALSLVRNLRKWSNSSSEDARCMSRDALEFANRHFAKELAEAEKGKEEAPER